MTSEPRDKADLETAFRNAVRENRRLKELLNQTARRQAEPIAIIAMACRAPGAVFDPDAYWALLDEGRDAIGPFPGRWDTEALYDPNPDTRGKTYSCEGGFLRDVDCFDADFFGISRQEALDMDPQQRLVLEVAWEALERAGIRPATPKGSNTGVYMGSVGSDYGRGDALETLCGFWATGRSSSVLSGRLSYVLGLQGPAMTVDTACSSSLVALHLACTGLRQGECDLALAGGVQVMSTPITFVEFSRLRGLARDGRCKAFSAAADGAGWAEGCGVLVLKRLSDARRDGDRVLALVRGSAVNQDGRSQGLTAPSGPSQQRVIRRALSLSGVSPDDIDAVEAHGTGTELGDPVEAGALAAVFGPTRSAERPLWLGSSKSNLGHTQAAAGVLGLMKMVLSLVHERLPKTLHAETPNKHIAWEGSGLALLQEGRPWPRQAGRVRRAGVSSFGFSGTIAHVVLEEMPLPGQPAASETAEARETPAWLPLLVSARDETALRAQAGRWAAWLKTHPETSWSDVLRAAALHRTHFEARAAIRESGLAEASEALTALAKGRRHPAVSVRQSPMVASDSRAGKLAALFTGQGSERLGMGRDLCARPGLEAFARAFDAAVAACDAHLDRSLTGVMWADESEDGPAAVLHQARYAEPALFALETALYRQWQAWGVAPDFLLGFSVGELVAAHVAGVFSVEDAAALVCARGRLVDAAAAAGGDAEALQTSDREGEDPHLKGPLEAFRQVAAGLTYGRPSRPVISNVTGRMADPEAGELVSADYWVKHLRQVVRFGEGVHIAIDAGATTFLECGPDEVLCGLVTASVAEAGEIASHVATLPSLRKSQDGLQALVTALGGLHVRRHHIDWQALFPGDDAYRVDLPTYAFQRQRYWQEGARSASEMTASDPRLEPDDWYTVPRWHRQPAPEQGDLAAEAQSWLIFLDEAGLGQAAAGRLEQAGHRVHRVLKGSDLVQDGGVWTIDGSVADHYLALLEALGEVPRRIVHLWSFGSDRDDPEAREEQIERSFYSLLYLAQALDKVGLSHSVDLTVFASGLHRIRGDEVLRPEKALVAGPCRVLPLEIPELRCRSVDLEALKKGKIAPAQVDQLLAELASDGLESVAYRDGERWVERFERLSVAEEEPPVTRLRQGGVYLITGGLGGIGLGLAEVLARRFAARLVLLGRTGLPQRDRWPEILDGDDRSPAGLRERIRKVRALEDLGCEVLVVEAEVTDPSQMRRAVERAEERFGRIHGVIHAAGIAGGGLVRFKTRESAARILAAKVQGTRVLEEVLAGRELDFVAFFSSIAAVTGGGLGQVEYCAANAFLDAVAHGSRLPGRMLSVNWGWWRWGLWDEALRGFRPEFRAYLKACRERYGVSYEEGAQALIRCLEREEQQIIVSPRDFGVIQRDTRLTTPANVLEPMAAPTRAARAHPRPDLETEHVPPASELERRISEVWKRHLGLDKVGRNDNFFDLGGNSLIGQQLIQELSSVLSMGLKAVTIYESPTVATMARALSGERGLEAALLVERPEGSRAGRPREDIAIVGMAGRFPGARNVEELWSLLTEGREGISTFSDEELRVAGVDPEVLARPNYVKSRPVLDDIDLFDAEFFDFTPSEARMTDPQQRLFLECAWEALENAGHDPGRFDGAIGVFAGTNISTYWLNMSSDSEVADMLSVFQVVISNDKDSLSTRTSYKLNLTGPSVSVQTHCSTSLVAVHMARQSLLSGDSDMVLAGGSAVRVPTRTGYLYEAGGTDSPDGHTRTFDAGAEGTALGDGVGVVVLKRLGDALRDGNPIYAVIKGSAINNDGSLKVGYHAPSVSGQSAVISAALADAGVDAETVSYVEAHGTATPLGDPIEIAALTQAFRRSTERRGFCAIGSAKSNLGHLDKAAGVTGLMKTALALQHCQIPPSVNFERPSPKLDLPHSPFYVVTELTEWKSVAGPRRAGVTALGMGGTNVHVVLEESPSLAPSGPSRQWHLLALSARTPSALEAVGENLCDFLGRNPNVRLADVAFTLMSGRRPMDHRRVVVCRDAEEARTALRSASAGPSRSRYQEDAPRSAVLLFPEDPGAPMQSWGGELYRIEETFRRAVDECAEILQAQTGLDLLRFLGRGGASEAGRGRAPAWMNGTMLFVTELALARQLMACGVAPVAILGYGLGELIAASLAGVLSLEDALTLVMRRCRRRAEPISETDLKATPEGPPVRPLGTPTVRFLSNVTGTWIDNERAADPAYWTAVASSPVCTDADPGLLVEDDQQVVVELGRAADPGGLAALRDADRTVSAVPGTEMGPRAGSQLDEQARLLWTLGELWLRNIAIDGVFAGEQRRRLALPTYPFERRRYWQGPDGSEAVPPELEVYLAEDRASFEDWFHVPEWRRSPLKRPPRAVGEESQRWLLLGDEGGVGRGLAERLAERGDLVRAVVKGDGFARGDDGVYTVRPASADDYRRLFSELGEPPHRIVHLWSLDAVETESGAEERVERHLEHGFFSLLALAQAIGDGVDRAVELTVVSSGMHRLTGREILRPEVATLLGPCRVVPHELAQLRCRSVDIDRGADGLEELLAELEQAGPEASQVEPEVVAYRDGERWGEGFVPLAPSPVPATPVRHAGVYVITGGLGGLGLGLARHLARGYAARLVLVGRTGLPDPASWPDVLESSRDEVVTRRIRVLKELEEVGAEVLVLTADAADEAQMRSVVDRAVERFGKIDGVIHAAGVPGAGVVRLKTAEMAARVLAPKVRGALVLDRVLAGHKLDFMVLFSSVVTITGGGPGQLDYCAANAFLDAFAAARSARGERTVAIDWNEWRWDAWQQGLAGFDPLLRNFFRLSRERFGISFEEGGRAFERALAQDWSRVVVSPRRMSTLVELSRKFTLDSVLRGFGVKAEAGRRPSSAGSPAAPLPALAQEELEARISAIFIKLLGARQIGSDDNFFERGGNSLLGLQVTAELKELVGRDVPATLLYEAPTAAALARSLGVTDDDPKLLRSGGGVRRAAAAPASSEIAIIGMAGRFPGARSPEQLWRNLCDGVESVTVFSDDELRAAGVDPALLGDPRYVKVGAVLDDIDRFDAELFGYSPREAELMDPQHRFFLECAWEALENAGYDPRQYGGAIGVFGGSNISTYLLNQIVADPRTMASVDTMQAGIVNSADSLTTKVSYKLGLTGPSVAVQTFCSTSAVASHLACRSLAKGDCDIALAGGVRIAVPHRVGYLWQTGGIESPDGHTRAFDARGQGSLIGNAVAIVVLKRLADARADGDRVYAVVRGTAMNNDGSFKAGYTAPSVDIQAEVIAAALAEASVEPESVAFIETHGTGTELGDPIEIAALRRAYEGVGDAYSCALGSVKTNVGHLDRASGATSLIKASLALYHGQIPATLHFERPNPETRLEESPFFVNTELRPWPAGDKPRYAGVNALGIGGTNVHFVLSEPPPGRPASPSRAAQLLVLSANTEEALETKTRQLAEHLRQHPEADLADVAFTLKVGRRPLPYRRTLVARTAGDALEVLEQRDDRRLLTHFEKSHRRPTAFLFPGLGDQYVGMAEGLYNSEPTFRHHLDLCAERVAPHLEFELREILFPASRQEPDQPDFRSLLRGGVRRDAASRRLNRTANVHPALFAVEYSLAQLLIEWIGPPAAMIGYSLGEYTAACLAGVLAFDDAFELVARRARMIDELPAGCMLAVPLSVEGIEPYLGAEVSLAAVNGPSIAVLAGSEAAIEAVEHELTAAQVACRRLATSHAFHSHMMEPIVGPLTELLEKVTLRPPRIPFVSSVTGSWITPEEATDPSYWARHLCRSVQFDQGLQELLKAPDHVFLEVGPGQTLGSFVKQHPAYGRPTSQPVVATLPAAFLRQPDQDYLMAALGKLWLAGVPVDWSGTYRHEKRQRVPLPTYPFADQRFWIGSGRGLARTAARSADTSKELSDWFYRPVWQPAELPRTGVPEGESRWLVLADGQGVGLDLAERLRATGQAVTTVTAGLEFRLTKPHEFVLDPRRSEHYRRLMELLRDEDALPSRIVHLWSLTGTPPAGFAEAQQVGFYSLIRLVQALVGIGEVRPLALDVVADGLGSVTDEEPAWPEKATLLGPCRVIPQELPHIACRVVDVGAAPAGGAGGVQAVVDQLVAELAADLPDRLVALRAGGRWVHGYEAVRLEPSEGPGKLRQGGVYLITGGLGGIGFVLAEHLARELDAKLVVTGRSELPERESWSDYLADAGADPGVARKIRRLQRLEELGADVLPFSADVADAARMAELVEAAESRFGAIHGLFHTAGLVRPDTFRPLAELTAADCESHFQPKVHGLLVLEQVLAGRELDFRLLFSSTSAVLGGLSLAAYASANLFMDAFARRRNRASAESWISVNWDLWEVHGEEIREIRERGLESELGEWRMMLTEEGTGMAPEAGIEAVRRVLAASPTELVHSATDLQVRLAQWIDRRKTPPPTPSSRYARPDLQTPYVPVRNDTERQVAEVFQDILGVQRVGLHDNYFDLGGTSLSAIQVATALQAKFEGQISPNILFEAPSVSELAKRLRPQEGEGPSSALAGAVEQRRTPAPLTGETDVAVIGMAGRFPGARDIDEFWSNLANGVETVSYFTDEELRASGVPEEEIADPSYVRARPVLDGVDLFDHSFFGYSPREAELMDPQHRVFLETVWTALEHAGYDAWRFDGAIGLFAGSNISTYLLGMFAAPGVLDSVSELETAITNDRDSLTTRASYKLNLRGPSVAVQTFCSTSLVATHLAVRSLIQHESDMAMAGGVSIRVPQKVGYRFDPGGQDSPDGHTRSFDARARGTVFGDGVGVVVLKRLEDALADGDTIHAVIKGSAINNDGSLKIGYTAPSVEGQAVAVATALDQAGVTAESISYVEAHGSATELGDPVEVAALTKAFRLSTDAQGFCALGSVKSNFGHVDRAAGVAGLIKTVMALTHEALPPSLHFTEPSPKIDFGASPFYVNTRLKEWKNNGKPRRAGVNSLGVGGTNVHLVLEEAPRREKSGPSRAWQLLPLSARTESALDNATTALASLLRRESADLGAKVNLADVAFTLQTGRRELDHRRFVVCRDGKEAAADLEARKSATVSAGVAGSMTPEVAFLFPAGDQYLDMGAGLYRSEAVFRREVDRCAEWLKQELDGVDLRDVVFSRKAPGTAPRNEVRPSLRKLLKRDSEKEAEASRELAKLRYQQPATFVVEYALARLLMAWGIHPQALMGHSLSEYVAACLAGVFRLEDALRLVAGRARVFQERLPCGGMLAVPLSEAEVGELLGEELSLAAVNAPSVSIVSGPAAAVDALQATLEERGVICQRLATTCAAHSKVMRTISKEVRALFGDVELSAPRIPFVSNVTGTWIEDGQATDPDYWIRHMCETVRFIDGIETLLDDPERILIEVGPGQGLSSFVKLHPECDDEHPRAVVPTMRSAGDPQSDEAFLLRSLGLLWVAGVAVDWKGFYAGERRHRLPLPTYPFERQRFWIEPRPLRQILAGKDASGYAVNGSEERPLSLAHLEKNPEVSEWFYVPVWTQTPPRFAAANGAGGEHYNWLVLGGEDGIGRRLVERLVAGGQQVVRVSAGPSFGAVEPGSFTMDPRERDHFRLLLEELMRRARMPQRVVHLWSLSGEEEESTGLDEHLDRGFYALIYLAQALNDVAGTAEVSLTVVVDGLQAVTGDERLRVEVAPLVGPCRVIPQEYPNLRCRLVDAVLPAAGSAKEGVLIEQLYAELAGDAGEPMVALQGGKRWVQGFEPLRLDRAAAGSSPLRRDGVYLITGGVGGIGLAVAKHLFERCGARLALTSRSGLPPREAWAELSQEEGKTADKVRQVMDLEAAGAEVLVLAADVADRDQMRRAVDEARRRFGDIHGVFHTAGVPAAGLMQFRTRAAADAVLAPKVKGTLVLEEVTADLPIDFVVLFSSMTSATGGGPGQVDYSAANAFLDAFAHSRSQAGKRVIALGWGEWQWDAWQEGLMGFDPRMQAFFKDNRRKLGVTFAEGMDAIDRTLSLGLPQVVVSTVDFRIMLKLSKRFTVANILEAVREGQGEQPYHPRPLLGASYVAPSSELEKKIARIWRDLLRLEEVGIHDNFFELGGNSLLGVDLIRIMKAELEVEIPMYALYESPTVADMVELVQPSRAESESLGQRRERGAERRARARELKQRGRCRRRPEV